MLILYAWHVRHACTLSCCATEWSHFAAHSASSTTTVAGSARCGGDLWCSHFECIHTVRIWFWLLAHYSKRIGPCTRGSVQEWPPFTLNFPVIQCDSCFGCWPRPSWKRSVLMWGGAGYIHCIHSIVLNPLYMLAIPSQSRRCTDIHVFVSRMALVSLILCMYLKCHTILISIFGIPLHSLILPNEVYEHVWQWQYRIHML